MKNKKILTVLTFLILVSWLSNGILASAQILPASLYEENADYRPNLIIADSDLTNYTTLNAWDIQQFLLAKGGALAQYIDPATNLTAANLIYQTAQIYHINPKFLLVLIQKEQSLVEDPNPSQNQYDWATGYSCYNGRCLPDFKGFSAQINAAANLFINRYLLDLTTTNCTVTNWCVGQAKTTQDGHIITPQNKVTAALFTYTPYRGGTITDQGKVGANYNFWKIWQRWFGNSGPITFWPDGSLLKTQGSSTIYVIRNNYRQPIASLSVFKSRYNLQNVITVSSSTLFQLPIGPIIRFPQYSLIQTPDKNIYLIVDDTKRLIVSKEDFRKLGFNPEEIESATYADLAYLLDGPDLSADTKYNLGALIKDPKSGGIYYVISSVKHPIVSPEILKNNFSNLKIRTGTATQLAGYETGSPVLFKDGTLAKSKTSPAIYVISQGKKYPFPSFEVFTSRGYNTKNIITTSQQALDLHEDGDPLTPILEATDFIDAIASTTASTTPAINQTSSLMNQ